MTDIAREAAVRMTDYINRSRESSDFEDVAGGYLVRFPDSFLSDMRKWTEVVRGEKRRSFDDMNGDSGPHRIDEGIVGKMAECACFIAGPAMPLERMTGRFSVDFGVYDHMDEETCYDCDLNDCVTVKTSGKWSESIGHTGWVANQDDPIRNDPEGKYVILCKYVSDREILIMGWAKATDFRGKWNDCISLGTKKCVYFDSGHFFHGSRKIHVFGGGAKDVMVPVSRENYESCSDK